MPHSRFPQEQEYSGQSYLSSSREQEYPAQSTSSYPWVILPGVLLRPLGYPAWCTPRYRARATLPGVHLGTVRRWEKVKNRVF